MRNVFDALSRNSRGSRALFLILTVTVIAVVACGRDTSSAPGAGDQGIPVINVTPQQSQCINHVQPEGAPSFDQIDHDRFEPQSEGLRFYDIEVGTGDTPQFGDAVSVEYTGWLDNGCMFDTSYPNEGPVNFAILTNNLIRGWLQTFPTMQEGGVRVIELAPDLGYSTTGFPPRIPPNSTLFFHINLVTRTTIQEAQATVEAEVATATAEAVDARATIVAGGIPDNLSPSCRNSDQPEDAPAFGDIDFDRLEELVEGVRFYDIAVGSGESPALADEVSVEYTGWLENGCMFDTSYPDEGPISFPLSGVIVGWQEGLSTMQPGGVRVIEIQPELAYGDRGSGAAIPPGATIIFHVELVGDEEEPAETDMEAEATAQTETSEPVPAE